VRFEQFFRDQTFVNAVTKKFGPACGEIMRSMLRISEVTTAPDSIRTQPISSHEIARTVPVGMQVSLEVSVVPEWVWFVSTRNLIVSSE